MSNETKLLRIKADLILVFVALMWGSAFAVQRSVANLIGVFTFNGLRFLLASFILAGVMLALQFGNNRRNPEHNINAILHMSHQTNIVYFTIAGVLLFLASALQQAGLRNTTAGNAGFITSLYVVLVPILLWIFWRSKIHPITWAGAILAVIGSLMLSGDRSWDFSNGDILVLIGALFWGLHVILVGVVGWRMNIILFALGQYLVAGFLNIIIGLLFERFDLNMVTDAMWAIGYTGLFSIALGYTLQIFAQKYSSASDTAIILSMEAVFASIFGFIFLAESFTLNQTIGSILILIAIIITAIFSNKLRHLDKLNIPGVDVLPDR